MKVCPVAAVVMNVGGWRDLAKLKGTPWDYMKVHKTGWGTMVVKLH
jgi:hypothetical protein